MYVHIRYQSLGGSAEVHIVGNFHGSAESEHFEEKNSME